MVRLRAALQQVGHRSGGRWKGVGDRRVLSARGGIQKLDFGKRLLSTYQVTIKSQKFNNSGVRKEKEKYILCKVCRKGCGIERGIEIKKRDEGDGCAVDDNL
jgi:hypothetical protein